MNKLTLILAILLSILFKDKNKDTTRLFNDRLEILKGRVKQLIEINHNHTVECDYPLTLIITTDFDKQGNIISQQTKDVVAGKLEKVKYLYKYDSNGQKVQAIIKSSHSKYIYKYGKDGNINGQQLYWGKGNLIGSQFYKYDSVGNLIEIDPDKGHYFYKVTYKYDKQNKLKEEDQQGIKTVDEYKSFDMKGNWLRMIRIEHVNRSPVKGASYPTDTITRKITYY